MSAIFMVFDLYCDSYSFDTVILIDLRQFLQNRKKLTAFYTITPPPYMVFTAFYTSVKCGQLYRILHYYPHLSTLKGGQIAPEF